MIYGKRYFEESTIAKYVVNLDPEKMEKKTEREKKYPIEWKTEENPKKERKTKKKKVKKGRKNKENSMLRKRNLQNPRN